MRWTRFVLAAALFAGACTQPAADDETPTPKVSTTESPSVVATGARMPDGTPLPEGCTGGAGATHTVAFVADGRAWALDPDNGRSGMPVSFGGPRSVRLGPAGRSRAAEPVRDPRRRWRRAGPPRRSTPRCARSTGAIRSASRWCSPTPKGIPRKRFVDDGSLIRLVSLPRREVPPGRLPPQRSGAGVRGGDDRGAGDLAVDERRGGSAAPRSSPSAGRSSPRSRSRRTDGTCGGRPSTRRATRSFIS